MGVADMDFRTLPHITEALMKRMGHQNWGYQPAPADFYDNIIAWNAKRYDQTVKPGSILNAHGVLDGCLSILKLHNTEWRTRPYSNTWVFRVLWRCPQCTIFFVRKPTCVK